MRASNLLALTGALLVNAADFNCMPGQSCWPSSEQWQAFNTSINGNLQITHPWAEPCYDDPNSEACQSIGQQNGQFEGRTKVYGSRQAITWYGFIAFSLSCDSRSTQQQISKGGMRTDCYYPDVLKFEYQTSSKSAAAAYCHCRKRVNL